ncbi:TPA: hypothetical protein N0F65_010698 [Lagenidium giganteum]|uniref:catechol O-methyltransferase n=1 Tax=Lagenidium giganteum TaxID=4803 RepID=A0AAV2ZA65_9STRA|nr:TPA: hypothetical protein N0F65_010698 [Lagenidium giganteum]
MEIATPASTMSFTQGLAQLAMNVGGKILGIDKKMKNSARACLEYVRAHAEAGNPASVVETIDKFATENMMMNVGSIKGAIVDQEIRTRKPEVMGELGGYSGYSAVRFASVQREVVGSDSHYYSCEFSPEYAEIVREMVAFAGLANQVTVIVGAFSDQFNNFADKHVDIFFIDHDKKLYLSDTQLMLDNGLLHDGAALIADNVLFPGAPEYREFLDKNPQFTTSLHEVTLPHPFTIQDAVHVATFHSADHRAAPATSSAMSSTAAPVIDFLNAERVQRARDCVRFVQEHAERGNAASVVAAMDKYEAENHMMTVGDLKGPLIDNEIRTRQPKVMVELGGYCGYSAVRFAALQQEVVGADAHFYSVEYEQLYADMMREVIAFAGLSNHITVIVGAFADHFQLFKDKNVDIFFIDHDKTVYLSDAQLMIKHGLLREGTTLIADNIFRPGAPEYLAYMQQHPQFQSTLHKVNLGDVEDAVLISTFHQ